MEPTRLTPAQEDEFARLTEEVARALHFGHLEQAKAGVARLIELAPHSTTAYELQGDVLTALRQTEAARGAYHRALEIEPANADAERKYAELSLKSGQKSWAAEAILAGEADKFRGATHKTPGGAALRSVLFPGLGQVYNGDSDLGIILAVLGIGLLMAALALFFAPLAFGSSWAQRAAEQMKGHAAASGPGPWGWISLVLGLGVYVYSIYEAYASGKAQQK
jgi:tetratricopeptide (TPR) repeat protein